MKLSQPFTGAAMRTRAPLAFSATPTALTTTRCGSSATIADPKPAPSRTIAPQRVFTKHRDGTSADRDSFRPVGFDPGNSGACPGNSTDVWLMLLRRCRKEGRKEGIEPPPNQKRTPGTSDAPLSGKGAQGPKTAKAAERTRRCDDGRDAPPKPDTTE